MAGKTLFRGLTEGSDFERITTRTRWIVIAGLLLCGATVAFLLSNLHLLVPNSTVLFFEETITWAIYALLVLGLNIQFGYTGLVNFGYLVFFLVGGYTFAILTSTAATFGLGLAWPIGAVAALLATVGLGGAFGVVALRLRDDFLAIVTLAALLVAIELVTTFDGITGGTNGIYGVPQLIHSLAGDFHTAVVLTTLFALSLVLLAYAMNQRLAEGPYGRVLRSIRSDELVSQTLGKQTFRYKVQVFIYGAVLAGVAGILLATHQGSLTPAYFDLHITIIVWVGMLLGGSGNNRSALAGLAVILGIYLGLQFAAGSIGSVVGSGQIGAIQQAIVGLVLVLVMRYRPEGIWGNPDELGVHE